MFGVSNKFSSSLFVTLAAVLPCTWASYQNFNDHQHSQNIDLGTFVGKHQLPPKVIRITKTVAVKVPVPYPVKVPYTVPYPVPYAKPYPVHVPKYIKIKEQVPIEVPVQQHQHQENHENINNQYIEQQNQHNNVAYAQTGYQTQGRDYNVNEGQQQFGGNEFGHNSEQTGAYSQQQHQEQQQQQQYQYQYEPQQVVAQQYQQFGGGKDQNIGAFGEYSTMHEQEFNYNNPQGDYSAQQLIYSNPRFGINAYYSRTNLPNTGKQTSSSKFESHQEHMNDNNNNNNNNKDYMPPKMTKMYTKNSDKTIETHYKQQKEFSSYQQQPHITELKTEKLINVVEQQEFPPYDKQQQMNYAGHGQAEDQRLQHDSLRNYANQQTGANFEQYRGY